MDDPTGSPVVESGDGFGMEPMDGWLEGEIVQNRGQNGFRNGDFQNAMIGNGIDVVTKEGLEEMEPILGGCLGWMVVSVVTSGQ